MSSTTSLENVVTELFEAKLALGAINCRALFQHLQPVDPTLGEELEKASNHLTTARSQLFSYIEAMRNDRRVKRQRNRRNRQLNKQTSYEKRLSELELLMPQL